MPLSDLCARGRSLGPRPRARALFGLILGQILLASGCKSSAEFSREADEQVYELVLARRAKLELGEAAFTIEPDPNSLRRRIERGETGTTGKLSQVVALQLAAENSRDYQSRKESLYRAALDLTLERWRFALQTGGSLSGVVDGQGDEAQLASAGGGVSLAKLLGSGARILGNVGLDFTRSLISSDGWSPASSLSLAVTQPLLAGFGQRIVEEPLTQAERDLVYEVRSFERFRRTFALDVESRYLRLLQAVDTVANQQANYDNIVLLAARNTALAEAGRMPDIELNQARQNELRSQNDLLDAEAGLQRQMDDFKLFVGLPITAQVELDSAELGTLTAPEEKALEIDETVASSVALATRLDHLTTLDQRDDAARQVLVAEDALRAGLALVATAGADSVPDKPLEYDFQDATWSAGLTYVFPWEKLPQRNTYRTAVIAHQSAVRDAEESEDQIRADLRDDLRSARTRQQTHAIQVFAVALAAERVESTSLKQEAGRALTRDVLEAEEALLNARNAATSALVDYTLARLSLYLDLELLTVDSSGIVIDPRPLEAVSAEGKAIP